MSIENFLSILYLNFSNFSSDRAKYETSVRSFRMDRKSLDDEFRKVVTRLQREADRDELFDENSFDQEDQLIANTERLERTSRKIQDAYRITVETEDVSILRF